MSGSGLPDARIRPARPADLDDLHAIETDAFASDQLERRALRHAIGSPTILALVSRGDGECLSGYALVQIRRGSRVGRLTSLAVRGDAAGRGLGRALLAAAEGAATHAGCDRMRLDVRSDNARARRLYEAAAYLPRGETADYYEDGGTALRFEKRLG